MIRRSIDERIGYHEEKAAFHNRKAAELQAKKEGRTLMGTKEEEKAFRKALRAHQGFGFTYVEMLGILKTARGDDEIVWDMDPSVWQDRIREAGTALLTKFLPKHDGASLSGEPLPEAPEIDPFADLDAEETETENHAWRHPGF